VRPASVGARPVVSEGRLIVGATTAWNTAIAIGGATGKSKLRLRHRLVCDATSIANTLQAWTYTPRPCNYPSRPGPLPTYEADEVAFE